ncbi:PREDICTED: beta-D-glucosyl crocetin beta-1,6-glucosyltransferase-like [Ipomoea nil]|uniref:beta-D-glucosyl crocetin beta-1,6-glucosyltransferase-like n=1 Tax=Ipomoea nil TaxID=35883 RepID=UPI0009012A2B|nr:PREDICTED: beta-D-glucosyl crocetin beta-1,6-glucosyltransferase-like [Ipomoea nil]XP_019198995.1 PREDICTED: beta-D-glucosyl crocetin beta-1,6-glucosyltransferase-like [Ipomoea nil]
MPADRRFRLLMLPWLAHGHLVPYLELANELHDRNFDIYLCSTPVVISSAKSSSSFHSDKIHTVEIHLRPTGDNPELLDPSLHTTKDLPRHLIFPLCKAFRMASPSFCDILDEIKPDLLIYDFFQPWAAEAAATRNIPAVYYGITGAASIAFTHHLLHKRSIDGFPFPAISMKPHELKNLRKSAENIDPVDRTAIPRALEVSTKICLINTSREIEGKYIDYLSEELGKTVVPIGSLIRVQEKKGGEAAEKEDGEIMKWLDGKKKHSTLYLSFGSEYYLTREEIQEIAKGLELSGANFIWVIRFPAGEETPLEEALPKGFLERVKGRGIIVEKWAPQIKILSHPSVGGFVMQCGWNSFLESIHFGIPLIAIPMHSEQFVTARMAVEVGIATEVLRDEDGRLHAEDIGKAVKSVLAEKGGEEMRAKVREVNAQMKMKGKQGIDNTAALLSELCLSNSSS